MKKILFIAAFTLWVLNMSAQKIYMVGAPNYKPTKIGMATTWIDTSGGKWWIYEWRIAQTEWVMTRASSELAPPLVDITNNGTKINYGAPEARWYKLSDNTTYKPNSATNPTAWIADGGGGSGGSLTANSVDSTHIKPSSVSYDNLSQPLRNVMDSALLNANSGLTVTNRVAKLGGTLLQDATIDGVGTKAFSVKNVKSLNLSTDSAGTAISQITFGRFISQPLRLKASKVGDPSVYGEFLVSANGTSSIKAYDANGNAGVLVTPNSAGLDNTLFRVGVDALGVRLENIPTKTTETDILYIDSNGYIRKASLNQQLSSITSQGEYRNDAHAAANGVQIGQLYDASGDNTMGLPPGTQKRRKF